MTCSENFCYYLLKKPRHWVPAHEECRRFHADLVSIHNESENQWITNTILREQNIDEVHLGRSNHLERILYNIYQNGMKCVKYFSLKFTKKEQRESGPDAIASQ